MDIRIGIAYETLPFCFASKKLLSRGEISQLVRRSHGECQYIEFFDDSMRIEELQGDDMFIGSWKELFPLLEREGSGRN